MIVSGKKIAVTNDINKNKENIIKGIYQASEQKADIFLTPEGCLSGYTPNFDQNKLLPALEDILHEAKLNKVGLALGTCFYENDHKCYNQIRFYHKNGNYLGFHSKVLKCGNHDDPSKGEVDHYETTSLKVFDWDGITIGGIICNDMWANPGCTPMPDTHISQQLSKLGAKVLFHAVNGGRDNSEISDVIRNYHESNLRLRARAGDVWVVTVDNSFPLNLPSAAPSGVISPEGNWAIKVNNIGENFFSFKINC